MRGHYLPSLVRVAFKIGLQDKRFRVACCWLPMLLLATACGTPTLDNNPDAAATAETTNVADGSDSSATDATIGATDGAAATDAGPKAPETDIGVEVDQGGQSCVTDKDCSTATFCANGKCEKDICSPGIKCVGAEVGTCQPNGGKLDLKTCPEGEGCWMGKCQPLVCTPLAAKCKFENLLICNQYGTAYDEVACPDNHYCSEGECKPQVCAPKQPGCTAAGTAKTKCTDDGLGWITTPCPTDQFCAVGNCYAQVCQPGSKRCESGLAQACNAMGSGWSTVVDCYGQDQGCTDGQCVPFVCKPKSVMCNGTSSMTCSAKGDAWTTTSCLDGDSCTLDGCALATGKCVNTVKECDDGLVCTVEACEEGECVLLQALTSNACADGSSCAFGANCFAGSCVPGLQGVTVTTLAGSGTQGNQDGAADKAQFSTPAAIVSLPDGSWLVGEYNEGPIRKVSATGEVSSLPIVVDYVEAMVVHGDILYVSSMGSAPLYKYSLTTGTLLATIGTGFGHKDGVNPKFGSIASMDVDAGGTVWIADAKNHCIRTYDPKSGFVATVAGIPKKPGLVDGTLAKSQFNLPGAITVLGEGRVLVADNGNGRLRLVDTGLDEVALFSGSGVGSADGVASQAKFESVAAMEVLKDQVWLVENNTGKVRVLSLNGTAKTITGGKDKGVVDGSLSAASFGKLADMAINSLGEMAVVEYADHVVRKVNFAATYCDDHNPCTADGCQLGKCVFAPLANGNACSSGDKCMSPGVCQDGACVEQPAKTCKDDTSCSADSCDWTTGECVYFPISGACDDGDACTTGEVCANAKCEVALGKLTDGSGGNWFSDYKDGQGNNVAFGKAVKIAPWDADHVLVADAQAHALRKVSTDGVVTTIAGALKVPAFADGPAATARFNTPMAVLVADGNTWVADAGNHRIRLLKNGVVTTVAGTGVPGFADGPSAQAQFNYPAALARRPDGTLLVADRDNHRIRSISPDGNVTTLAGAGFSIPYSGDAATAGVYLPTALCIDSKTSAVFVANYEVGANSNRVMRILHGKASPWPSDGPIAFDGPPDFKGSVMSDCVVAPDGSLLVADYYSRVIRRLRPDSTSTVLTGNPAAAPLKWNGQEGAVDQKTMMEPTGLFRNADGSLWIADRLTIMRWKPPAWDCNDGNPCTVDLCDSVAGSCSFTPLTNGTPCEDGAECTINSACAAASCKGGTATICDDGDNCTSDGCDVALGCVYQALPKASCCVDSPLDLDFKWSNTGSWSVGQKTPTWHYLPPNKLDPLAQSYVDVTSTMGSPAPSDAVFYLQAVAPIVVDGAVLTISYLFDFGGQAPPYDSNAALVVEVDGVIVKELVIQPPANTPMDLVLPLYKSMSMPPKVAMYWKLPDYDAPYFEFRVTAARIDQPCAP